MVSGRLTNIKKYSNINTTWNIPFKGSWMPHTNIYWSIQQATKSIPCECGAKATGCPCQWKKQNLKWGNIGNSFAKIAMSRITVQSRRKLEWCRFYWMDIENIKQDQTKYIYIKCCKSGALELTEIFNRLYAAHMVWHHWGWQRRGEECWFLVTFWLHLHGFTHTSLGLDKNFSALSGR
jgi:hypothetical protein